MNLAKKAKRKREREAMGPKGRKHMRHLKGCEQCREFFKGNAHYECATGARLFKEAGGTIEEKGDA